MKSSIYIFSGLGADERVLELLRFPNHEVTFIPWLKPAKNESLQGYAQRLACTITAENPILLGLSFGGIVATEVAKMIQPKQVILIASIKTKAELPWYYKIAGVIGLHHLLPHQQLTHANFVSYWLFGTKSPSEKQLLYTTLAETDVAFLK